MDMPQIPDKNASFHFARFEKEYGSIGRMEPLCPGVYEVVTGPSEKHSFFGGEYIIVVGDTPAVSPEARAYGIPVPDDPDVLVYDSGESFSKGRWVIQYEAHKYLADHDLPLPQYESLAADRVYGMEICPEYFGEFPQPSETPWGPPVQSMKIVNGLFWLKTELAGWVLAVAYPLCGDLTDEAGDLAILTKYDREQGIDNTFGFCFFTYGSSSVPIFELSRIEEDVPWRKYLNEAALKNAILTFEPGYARWYNSCDDEPIVETPHAGIDFYPSLPR